MIRAPVSTNDLTINDCNSFTDFAERGGKIPDAKFAGTLIPENSLILEFSINILVPCHSILLLFEMTITKSGKIAANMGS